MSDEKLNDEQKKSGQESDEQADAAQRATAEAQDAEAAEKKAAKETAPQEAPKKGDSRYTYEELTNQTVAQLREMAKGVEHEAVRGYSTMHKEELLTALCAALGIEAHVHHEVVGIDKRAIKDKIRSLKAERDKAMEAGDRQQLKIVRRRIHRLKRKLRAATV